jgi:lipid II:glycine glycyltransferase (peptidoglycan interpeptide bridge formation enzyme)
VPRNKGKFVFAFHKERMIFGGVYIFNKKEIDAFMMSADSEYMHLRASYLVTHNLLEWANKNRVSVFNWMSSPKRDDGIYRWKKKWGSNERTFLYLTKVLGDASYWKEMEYRELKKAYSFHYLLPFNLLKSSSSRFTTKDELSSFIKKMALLRSNSEKAN